MCFDNNTGSKPLDALISILVPTDEKERFDPSQFQESIVQGLNQTGTDLEAVAKFLDASGAKLDYRRYAETLFDILVAGGMLGKCQITTESGTYCNIKPDHFND